jgi:hypothetical protein
MEHEDSAASGASCNWVFAWLVVVIASARFATGADDACMGCNREMRRTLEAIQAWRRLHNGMYPGRLVDLKSAGLLPPDGAICPEVLKEANGANAAHNEITSRGEDGDPAATYEYEMSSSVRKSREYSSYLPEGSAEFTRQDWKTRLLRRPFFEQVPILRCSSHRAAAPASFSSKESVRRNGTVTGEVYWSELLWEQLWLDDVPYCAREANAVFGLQGPPFHTDRAPSIPQAVDLRQWSCALGDHAWWWTLPFFKPKPNWETAAHLRPFFQANHGRTLSLGAEEWWIDGLVQLQGRVKREEETYFEAPGLQSFVWKKTGTKVDRRIAGAAWLQGTVWTAPLGETAGWLVWHYQDGASEKVPIIYGRTTARFWGDGKQLQAETGFPEPVWSRRETEAEAGKERWLRLYRQEWRNPRPGVLVAQLDFVSNDQCRAAPFLIAVNTR